MNLFVERLDVLMVTQSRKQKEKTEISLDISTGINTFLRLKWAKFSSL